MHVPLVRRGALATAPLLLAAFLSPAMAQSTNRRRPEAVTSKAFRHPGEGRKVEHFYSFVGGPGLVKVTMEMQAKEGASNVDFELFDAAGSKLFYNYMNATSGAEVATKQAMLRRKQTLLLAVTADAGAAYYAVILDGAVEIPEPTAEAEAATEAAPAADAAPPTAAAADPAPAAPASTTGLELDVLKLAGERRKLPATGVLVVVMKDGATQQFDLAAVNRVTIRK